MAGAVLGIGVIAVAGSLTAGLVVVGGGVAFAQRLAGAADAAALAAADAVSGAVGGDPCVRAAQVAAANGAEVAACELDGLIATVRVTGAFGRLHAEATARAGPPPAAG